MRKFLMLVLLVVPVLCTYSNVDAIPINNHKELLTNEFEDVNFKDLNALEKLLRQVDRGRNERILQSTFFRLEQKMEGVGFDIEELATLHGLRNYKHDFRFQQYCDWYGGSYRPHDPPDPHDPPGPPGPGPGPHPYDPPAPVPEPSTIMLMGSGLSGLLFYKRKGMLRALFSRGSEASTT